MHKAFFRSCREIWWFFGEFRSKTVLLLLLAAVCSTSALVPPWILGSVVDLVTGNASGGTVAERCVLMFGLMILLHSVRVLAKRGLGVIQTRLCASARERALDQLLALGLREGRLVGNEVARLDGGIRDFVEVFRIFQNEILFTSATLIATSILFIRVDPGSVVVLLLYFIAVSTVLSIVIPRARAIQQSILHARETFSGLFANVLGNSLSVRADGAEKTFAAHVGSSARSLQEQEVARIILFARQWLSFNLINSLFLSVILYRLGLAALNQAISISMLIIAFGYMRELISSSVRIFEVFDSLLQNFLGFRRLLHLLAETDQVFERTKLLSPHWEKLVCHGVSHSYDGRERPVLHDLHLEITAGERLGISGPSGSGKSTLIKILLGLISPSAGNVTLDGVPLAHFSLSSLRSTFAVALQECEILGLSLRDNITMLREVDLIWLERVLQICGLDALVRQLPLGLDTIVGEKGYKLSGGERQRVSLARAVIRKPKMLIIDEATSMLDSDSEYQFFTALQEVLPHLTLVVISHHARTYQFVERVIHMEYGSVKEKPICRQAFT